MNLFEQTVAAALEINKTYTALRPVVEKELLHYDILSALNKAGYLKNLTFIGGTCLRVCYGSERLSEDLDFTGGFKFQKNDLRDIGQLLKKVFWQKYNFPAEIFEPIKDSGNTATWKIKIITSPERLGIPQQRINLDICALPSYERQPAMAQDHYGLALHTSGLILLAESRVELLVDKIMALALRPNRVKNRDLWDIVWLKRRNIELSRDLLTQKLADRQISRSAFGAKYTLRLAELSNKQPDFLAEMRRFLPPAAFDPGLTDPKWWDYLLLLLKDLL